MRGNPAGTLQEAAPLGSIPAHAGKPGATRRFQGLVEVYPRACGETRGKHALALDLRGLSPRMRGNLVQTVHGRAQLGSIPAHAGKPSGRK